MSSILLVVIYIAFISLGLPDSLLGSAWPSMYQDMGASVSWAGIISMIISCGTIISSLNSGKLLRKLGTGRVTVLSVGMTALALMGFAMSRKFWNLCIWAVPYGLGAGSVDAALNNYVALHYKSRHMSWLHCFWGIGATAGPYIMGMCLGEGLGWDTGYEIIGIFQIILTACLFFSLSLWKGEKQGQQGSGKGEDAGEMTIRSTLRLPGAGAVLISFFCYCAMESTTGLWASSYMVLFKGINAKTAASWASMFYLGITAGRFLAGFVTDKMGDKNMIRLGQIVAALGIVCLMLPGGKGMVLAGLILLGLGSAPIYPSIIHATPENFGAGNSQSIMGLQMAFAYVGSTVMPPLFGMLAEYITIQIYPFYLLFFVVLMAVMSEKVNLVKSRRC